MKGIKPESIAKKTLYDIVKPLIESGKYEEQHKKWKEEFQAEIKAILN